MNKFDDIIKKILVEDGTQPAQQISSQQINNLQQYLKTAPQQVKDTMGAMTKAQDPDPNHAVYSDVINPSTNTKFTNLKPDQKEDFLKRLAKAGVPLQQPQQQQKNANPTPKTTQNPATTSSGNPTTDQNMGDEGSAGY